LQQLPPRACYRTRLPDYQSELWFKAAFVAAFVYAVTIAARTARLAAKRHGGSINQLAYEVRYLAAIRGALGIIFYVSLFLWLFRGELPMVMRVPMPIVFRWTATALLVPVLAFYTSSFHALNVNYRGGVGLYDDHRLVTHGPYRWVRHPIYASFIAIMILMFAISANWVLALSGLALVTSIAIVRVPIEEKELAERFGSAWSDYARRTRRGLPFRR
jgi:protein-S-isoprenylcysteine O-methyltransferase Ste14